MARVVIDHQGTKRYYDDNDTLHREDGPAMIRKDGKTLFWIENQFSSANGPAINSRCGTKEWRHRRTFGRDIGPTIDCPNGAKYWYNRGDLVWPKL